ncbi:MAG: ATP-binding protein [Acidobacteriota bacterium]|nr:ATP-binding protein [Acidobacteriota bacterium]
MVALAAAAAIAGPWPSLSTLSLGWRLPLVGLAIWVGRGVRAWQRWAIAALAVVALVVDAGFPARRTPQRVAAAVAARVTELGDALGALGQKDDVLAVLTGAGGEATPETAFAVARSCASRLPVRPDALVVVNERSLPVAWTGVRPRLPLRLRALGERTVVAEAGVGETWLWWREAVFESGRSVGGLLAGVRLPASGTRTLLGVSAGRLGEVVADAGGDGLVTVSGTPLLRLSVRARQPVLGSQPALALALAFVVLAWHMPTGWRVPLGLMSLPIALAAGWVGRGWWLVVALAALVLGLGRPLARRLPTILAGVVLGGLAGVTPWLLRQLEVGVGTDSLLWPGALRSALVLAWVMALRKTARPRPGYHVLLRALAWLPLVVGAVQVEPWMVAVGVVLAVWPGGAGHRLLPAAAVAAMVLLTADEVNRRARLVTQTDTALATTEVAASTAHALLAKLPEEGLSRLARLDARERLVAFGREVVGVHLGRKLPGVAVELVDPGGTVVGVWGDAAWRGEDEPWELARRTLANGWRVQVTSPPSPHNLLSTLTEAGLGQPVVVFDRGGAPLARGATFQPLSPSRVGAALAAGRSWGPVGVGERLLPSYLRAVGDWVVAVPWIRLPLAGQVLKLAALVLWGALPVGAWAGRRRWRRWWVERHTFLGRLRVLLAAATVVPVLLLAQVLPAQWARQRERAQLELGRAVSRSLAAVGREEGLAWLVRETGGTVAVYRSGALVSCTRPDHVALGRVPWLPPEEAFTRAVRGWREPVVDSGETTSVHAPLQVAGEPVVVAALGLQVGGLSVHPTPTEWFAITGVMALAVALAIADRLGRRLARPLRRLVGAARRLEHGLPVPALAPGSDEDLGALGRAFTTMASGVQRREEELRRERDLRERVLAALSAAVLVVNHRGEVDLANPAARRLIDHDPGIRGLDALLPAPLETLAARARDGEEIEEVVQPRGRPEARWKVTVLPLGGAPARLLVVLEDLSELARAERLASLAELARIAAHEVKNPLTPIRLWAEELQAALAKGPDRVAPLVAVAASQILERVEHLHEVAQSFGNLAALEQWEAKTFDLLDVARLVVREYRVLPSRGITVSVHGDSSHVHADPQWVGRALRHLLENSVRVLGERGGVVEVEVRPEDSGVVLAVRDSGGGVPEEVLGRLFEPHFSTTSQGSGLGLAVVARVLARAGGHAGARNGERGLEVRLWFPGV